MDELTKRRLAHNEEVFRAVNEEVSDAHAGEGRSAFVCECADRECTERVLLTPGEYRSVRADPRRFAVAPGHVVPDLEEVVEHHGAYDVVEKHERLL